MGENKNIVQSSGQLKWKYAMHNINSIKPERENFGI